WVGPGVGVVRVVGREVGEREHLARRRVEDDGRTARRTGGGDPALELALGRLLDAGVERELQAAALVRRRSHPAGEHLPPARIAAALPVLRLAAYDAVDALPVPVWA